MEPYTEYLKLPRKIILKSIHVELESEYIQGWQELGETFGDMLRVQNHFEDYRIDDFDSDEVGLMGRARC